MWSTPGLTLDLAKNYSEGPNKKYGGDLGYVARGQLLREIDTAIFSMEKGDVAEVIESPVGYHVCKVYDQKEAKVIPFEEVRQKITEILYREKVQEKFDAWIEELKSNAYISIR